MFAVSECIMIAADPNHRSSARKSTRVSWSDGSPFTSIPTRMSQSHAWSSGSGLTTPPSTSRWFANATGLNRRRNGNRSGNRRSQRPVVEHRLVPRLEVCRHDIERDFKVPEVVGKSVRQERFHDLVRIELHVEPVLEHAAQVPHPHAPKARGNDPHGPQNTHRMLAQFRARHPVGPARADQRAD